ncbi:MAG: branched-chain amino acid ABC transporter permease [Candidatus Dormibacteria bacterium]
MNVWGFYISTLVIYFGVDLLSGIALNLQFGYAGVVNFGFVVFQAAGAYAAAVVLLGPSGGVASFQQYVFGSRLPFPVDLLIAAGAGALLSLVVGLFSLRRMRRDYQAAVLLIVSLILVQLVSADVPLFNGSNGLTGVGWPLGNLLHISVRANPWTYAIWVLAICAVVYVLVSWLSRSPWGRSLRAMRDHEAAASAMGLNITSLRLQVFVLGGAIAGLSGGLLVEYLGAWSPGAWGYVETFVIFTAIFVGGVGNYRGVILGVLLVPVIFLELPRFLPAIGYPGLIDSLQWVVIGLAWMLCLLFRPRGILPERRLVMRPPAQDIPSPAAPAESRL